VTHGLRKLTLGGLYCVVALLVAVPPVYLLATTKACAPPCEMTSRQLFTADTAVMWLVPFGIAAILLALVFKLKNRS
jgi:hypothetical protein